MESFSPIELAEKEVQRDKDDLKRLKKRYPGYDFVRMDNVRSEGPNKAAAGELSEFDNTVLDIVNSDAEKEWTSRLVVDELRLFGTRLPEKDQAAMNAVGASLIALRDAEKIIRKHDGRGRDPHRYSALHMDQEASLAETS